MTTNKITYQFKDPNDGTNFIPFWSYNDDGQEKIDFKDTVRLDSNCLTNISDLITNITQHNNTFWKEVDENNLGYVPQGKKNNFLYIDEYGQAKWVQPKYYKTSWFPEVQYVTISDHPNSILSRIGDTTDHILNLNNFLLEVNIDLNPNSNLDNLTVETNSSASNE